MLQYLATVQARNMSIVDCLNFLFQLSFATLGKVSTIVLLMISTLMDNFTANVRHNGTELEIPFCDYSFIT